MRSTTSSGTAAPRKALIRVRRSRQRPVFAFRINIDDLSIDAPAGHLLNECGRAVARVARRFRCRRHVRIDKTLRWTSPSARDVFRIESESKLALSSKHVGRFGRDLRCRAAHYAGDRNRTIRIGDHQHGRIERAAPTPSSVVIFSSRSARRTMISLVAQRVRVESVQRLAEFQHHVIRDVGDVVDGTHAESFQTILQPIRRRTDLHACDVASAVTRRKDRGRRSRMENTSAARLPRLRAIRISAVSSGSAVNRATSRATPRWLRQSGRFVATSSSIDGIACHASSASTASPTTGQTCPAEAACGVSGMSTNSLSQL